MCIKLSQFNTHVHFYCCNVLCVRYNRFKNMLKFRSRNGSCFFVCLLHLGEISTVFDEITTVGKR